MSEKEIQDAIDGAEAPSKAAKGARAADANALAIVQACSPLRPSLEDEPSLAVCSALSTGNMSVFEPPPWARKIIFCADADSVGLSAAAEAAKRMKARGLKSVVAVPPKIMTDFSKKIDGE